MSTGFGGYAPRLTELELHNVFLDRKNPYPAFHNVRNILLFAGTAECVPIELVRRLCPRLEALDIRGRYCVVGHDPIGTYTTRRRPSHELNVILGSMSEASQATALAEIIAVRSKIVSITNPSEDPVDKLEELMAGLAEDGREVLWCGDLNGRTGASVADAALDPPRLSMDTAPRNPRGNYILRVAQDNDMCILNGACGIDKVDGGCFTSFQHNGFAVVDYAILSRNGLQRVHQFEVHAQSGLSDHAILEIQLTADFTRPNLPLRKTDCFTPADVLEGNQFSDIDRELHDLMQSRRTWEEAMADLYGPVRCTDNRPIQVYTDGSCIEPGTPRAAAGSGVYWGPFCDVNRAERLPGPEQTNNRAELYAVLLALYEVDALRRLVIHSDSEYVIRSIAEWAPMRAELDWSCKNGDLLRQIVWAIRRRAAN